MDAENRNQSNKPEPISPDWVHERDADDFALEEIKSNSPQPDDGDPANLPNNNEEPMADTDRVVLRSTLSDSANGLESETSAVADEITDQVHIPPKIEKMSTDPVSAGKPSLVATHRELTSTDLENDLGEYEESQFQQKRGKRFMGMSAGQRFFFFLFFLIIVVVLGTLFLALSGKIALPFLVALFS